MASQCQAHGSGVTIGRGYDLKHRSPQEIIHHLVAAGVPAEKAKRIAEGDKKSHCAARDFVRKNKNIIDEITEVQQLRLFKIIYPIYVEDSIRFYNKFKKQNSVSWDKLHPILKDVFVDMKYQGVLNLSMVPIFGLNRKEEVIRLIRDNKTIFLAEPARGRISYMQRNMK